MTSATRSMGHDDHAGVAYVVTHHPRVSLTFIAREVEELERLGTRVVPISMNACTAADVATRAGRAERDRTFYLKQAGARRTITVLARVAVASPWGFARLIGRAIRSARTDVREAVWRVFHVVEGALAWDHCRRQGVRHLHAHFGQSPANIAWFASEVGNLVDGDGWTWSFTIHGFQDFVNEQQTRMDLKVASATFVVCVSDFTRSQLMRVSQPEHWHKYHVVRCGIDIEDFPLRRAAPSGGVPCVITVARISPEKGHVVLVEALRILQDRGVKLRAEFVGGGDFSDAVQAEAARFGVAGAVELVGEVASADVLPMLEQADVFCLPSFSEGLPVSIMEAMAIGVPVVSTFISGIPELAVDGVTALTVPAGNPTALADALQRLVTEPGLGERLSHAARERVVAAHSLPVNVAELANLFAMATEGRHDRAR